MRGLGYRLYRRRHFTSDGRAFGYPQRLDLLVQVERREREEREEAERAAESSEEDRPDSPLDSPDDPHDEEVSLAQDAQSAWRQPEDPDAWLEHDPMINSGYAFHYAVIDSGGPGQPGNFALTASPLEYGKTGTLSFFIDATCVLRSTSENREAGKDDAVASWDGGPGNLR
jgi:hypothetical protein